MSTILPIKYSSWIMANTYLQLEMKDLLHRSENIYYHHHVQLNIVITVQKRDCLSQQTYSSKPKMTKVIQMKDL